MTGISLKYELNSNTLVMVLGFVTSLVSLVLLWSDSQHSLADNTRRIEAHDVMFKAISDRFDVIDKRDADTRDLQFRVGALEKGQESADTRVSRIVESYGNKFTELGVSVASINTQLALIAQSQQRLEGMAKTPVELRSPAP